VAGGVSRTAETAEGVVRSSFREEDVKTFMISARDRDGVDEVTQHLLDLAKPGDW
jgi:hypothetical protein